MSGHLKTNRILKYCLQGGVTCTIIQRSMSTWPDIIIIWKQIYNLAGVTHKEGVICTTIPGAIVQWPMHAWSYGQSSIRFISFTLHVHIPFNFYQLASSNNFSLHFSPSSFGAAAKYLQKKKYSSSWKVTATCGIIMRPCHGSVFTHFLAHNYHILWFNSLNNSYEISGCKNRTERGATPIKSPDGNTFMVFTLMTASNQ